MTDTTVAQSPYLTVEEVAEDLRVARMTVYRMIHRGELKAITIGSRTFRVLRTSYAEYKAARHAEAETRGQVAPIPGQTSIPA